MAITVERVDANQLEPHRVREIVREEGTIGRKCSGKNRAMARFSVVINECRRTSPTDSRGLALCDSRRPLRLCDGFWGASTVSVTCSARGVTQAPDPIKPRQALTISSIMYGLLKKRLPSTIRRGSIDRPEV